MFFGTLERWGEGKTEKFSVICLHLLYLTIAKDILGLFPGLLIGVEFILTCGLFFEIPHILSSSLLTCE